MNPLRVGHKSTSKNSSKSSAESERRKSAFDRHFELLEVFMKSQYPNGCFIARSMLIEERLYGWVRQQRHQYRRRKSGKPHRITAEQIRKLESLGFYWENPDIISPGEIQTTCKSHVQESRSSSKSEDTWDVQFGQLVDHIKTHGSVVASLCHPRLASWVAQQQLLYQSRNSGKASSLSDKRAQKLESIGFLWVEDAGGDISSDVPPKNLKRKRVVKKNIKKEDLAGVKRLGRRDLRCLYVDQINSLECLKKGRTTLKIQLGESQKENGTLQERAQELKRRNRELEKCNQNLRRNHHDRMLEQRAKIAMEIKARMLAEAELEQMKQQKKSI